VKLGTICSRVTSGGTPSTKRPEYYGGTIPWLRTQEVDFKPIYSTELFITEDGLNNSSAKWIPENTVIVAMYGATAGRSAITKIALTTNQACCNLIIDEAQADYRFVYYSLRLRYEELEGLAKGSAQTNLNAGIIKEFEIPLPPLPVQRRIADILSEYDDLIENNRRRIAILEETARLTYRKWFGGMEQGKAATLGKICREVRRGVSPDVIAPDTPYIGLEHMPRRSISLCEWESAQKVTSTKLAFEAGDILFGKIRPYFHKVGITFVDGVASSDAIVIKPLRPELHAYVLMTVSSDAFVAAASQGMKEGSKMPRADWKQLLNYSVAMPDDDTLAEFNKVLNPILEQLKTLCFSIRNLAAARDMLLPRLMKGEMV
jgi:type I restriction enzyme S subunit